MLSKSTAPACALLVLSLAAVFAPSAHAINYYRDTSAGGACHPANGGAGPSFVYGNHTIANVGTTDQYVVCHFDMGDTSGAPLHVNVLQVFAYSANAGKTLSCVAQTGAMMLEGLRITSSVTRSHTFDVAGTYGTLYWENALTRTYNEDVLTLNCKMPAGTKLGLIEHRES